MASFTIVLIFLSLLLSGISNSLNGTSGSNDFYIFLLPLIIYVIINNIIKNHVRINKPIKYFLLFFLTIFISLVINDLKNDNTVNIFLRIKSILSYSYWPLIYLLVITQKQKSKNVIFQIKLFKALGLVIAISTIMPAIIYQFSGLIIGEFTLQDGKFRSIGFLTDQVGFALIYFLIASLKDNKYFTYFFYLFVIIITGTRGAIIIAIISSVYIYFFQQQQSKYSLLKMLRIPIFLLIIVTFLISIFVAKPSDKVLLRFDRQSIENTSNQRIGAIRAGTILFIENPFFGVGLGHFPEIVYKSTSLLNYFNFSVKRVEDKSAFANAQNQIVDIAVNGGLLSLIYAFLFMYYAIKTLKNNMLFSNKLLEHELHSILLFLLFMIIFNQTAIYLFNPGISSFTILILLGISNSRIENESLFRSQNMQLKV